MYATQLRKRRKVIITVVLFVLVFSAILNADWSYSTNTPLEIVSCKHLESEDGLPSADSVKLPSKSIFFHETSCNGGLNARQACTVESAARSHPDWAVNVLFTEPATNKTLANSIALLKNYKNVNFYRIHLLKYAKDTPLEQFIARGELLRTLYPMTHVSDVIRFISLYKWGGMYLDLDSIVAKPLGSLAKNWAARESDWAVSTGAIALSTDAVGKQVAEATLRDIEKNFRGDRWAYNGPGVITRVLKKMCTTANVTEMTASTCNGFEVYGPEYFFPIKWTQAQMYFEKGHIDIEKSYIYHVWNHQTHNLKIQRGSPYETLAKKFCPIVYNFRLKKFKVRNLFKDKLLLKENTL